MLRAPTALYRLGLGWLLGHHVVLLEHRGHSTGRLTRTALEVVHWDRTTREVLVVAGSGPGAEWYRNVLAHPLVRVSIGRERNVAGCAVPLSDDDARSVLERYRSRHPRVARLAARVLRLPVDAGSPLPADVAERLPAVVIDLAPPRRHRARRRSVAA
jgi:deazaflavin-dependent oxidoreductase (nitroreductase family)